MRRPLALLPAAVALGVVAGALPAPALMPLAFALALVSLASWPVTALAARRMVVTRTAAVHEAWENEPVRIHFEVRRLGRLPVALEVRDGAGAWTPLDGDLELRVPRPGVHVVAPSAVRVRDRLGIAERRVSVGEPERLLILPAPDGRGASAPPARSAAGDPEPDGLQAYAPGVPLARIHWPALARGAGLHARRLAAGPQQLPLVVVDTSGPLQPGALDWAARAAAGQVLRLARDGGCRVRLPGDPQETTVAGAAAWNAVHRRLAALAPAPPTPAPPAAIRIAAAAISPAPPPPLPCGVVAAAATSLPSA
jgi:uncharacterized protein (DUF58 family)